MNVVLKWQSVWQKPEMIMWFGVGLIPPLPVLAKKTVSALCQKWHSRVTKIRVPQEGSNDIYLGKAPPAFDNPLPATVTNPVPSLSNIDLTVCKAILETEAKSLK